MHMLHFDTRGINLIYDRGGFQQIFDDFCSF